MAYTNDFLAFAGASTANVMTQASYASSSWLTLGFVTGTAQSPQLNKVWRQGSLIAHTIGAFMAAYGPGNVVDDGTTNGQTTLLSQFTQAVTQVAINAVPTNQFLALTGGTLTGGVTSTASATGTGTTPQIKIQPTSASSDAVMQLNRSLGNNALIYGMSAAGVPRWALNLGNADAENTGVTDAGSNAYIARFHDHDSLAGVTPPFHAGDLIDYPIFINRATGVVTFSRDPQVGSTPGQAGNLKYLALDGTGQMTGDIQARGFRFFDDGTYSNSIAFSWSGAPAALHVWQAAAGGARADRGALAFQSWVTSQGYLTAIPTTYATQSWVQSQGYLTAVPAGYATTAQLANYLLLTGGTLSGGLTIGSPTNAAGLGVYGASSFVSTLAITGTTYFSGDSNSTFVMGTVTNTDPNNPTVSARIHQWDTAYYDNFIMSTRSTSSGPPTWTHGTRSWQCGSTPGQAMTLDPNANGYIYGTWTVYGLTSSDERLKTDIRESDDFDSLKAVRVLRDHAFTHRSGHVVQHGLVAQHVRAVMPDVVSEYPDWPDGTPLLRLDNMALLTHAYRAIQQLADRIEALEKSHA